MIATAAGRSSATWSAMPSRRRQLIGAVARQHEDRRGADRPAEAHVAAVVPDHERPGEIEAEPGRGLERHAGGGLPARAAVLRGVRAHEQAVEGRPLLAQELLEPHVDGSEPRRAQQTSPDLGLVRHDHHPEPELLAQADDRGGGSRDQLDLVGVVEVGAFGDDRPVAVEQREAPAHVPAQTPGAQVVDPRVARTPSARKENGANWPPAASSAARTAGWAPGRAAISR